MPSSLRARLRRAVLGKTDAKIARQQRQLDAQSKDIAAARAQHSKRADALSARVDKVLAAETQSKKVGNALQKSFTQLSAQLADLTRRTDELAASVAALTSRADQADAGQRARDVEFEIRRTQLGVLETRLGQLEEDAVPVPVRRHAGAADGDGSAERSAQVEEAADLLAAIRREHEQIRVRMQITSLYEERLRRVEESLLRLYDGDHRHRL